MHLSNDNIRKLFSQKKKLNSAQTLHMKPAAKCEKFSKGHQQAEMFKAADTQAESKKKQKLTWKRWSNGHVKAAGIINMKLCVQLEAPFQGQNKKDPFSSLWNIMLAGQPVWIPHELQQEVFAEKLTP